MSEKKPKVLFIAPAQSSKTTHMILEEAKKEFDCSLVPIYELTIGMNKGKIKIMHKGRELKGYDYIFPRIDSKRAEYGFDIISAFDYTGVKKPYHAKTIRIAHDKFLTGLVLSKEGIPVPKTYLAKTKEALRDISRQIKFPAMIKLLSGSGGRGIIYVEDINALESIMSSFEILGQHIIVQEFVESGGKDLRVLVAGDTIIGAMKRIAKNGEKRANICVGGTGERYVPGDEIKELSIKTAKALDTRLCAVDIIESSKGPVVLEANINFGIQGISKATDANIAKKIVEFIADELKIK